MITLVAEEVRAVLVGKDKQNVWSFTGRHHVLPCVAIPGYNLVLQFRWQAGKPRRISADANNQIWVILRFFKRLLEFIDTGHITLKDHPAAIEESGKHGLYHIESRP